MYVQCNNHLIVVWSLRLQLVLYVTHERSEIENGYDVDLHLFDPSTSPKGVLRTISLEASDKKRERTKRELDWIRSNLKEELGKLPGLDRYSVE